MLGEKNHDKTTRVMARYRHDTLFGLGGQKQVYSSNKSQVLGTQTGFKMADLNMR